MSLSSGWLWWIVSPIAIALGVVSVLIGIALLVLAWRNEAERRRECRKQELQDLLLEYLDDSREPGQMRDLVRASDRPLFSELHETLGNLVRGDSADRVRALMSTLGVVEYELRKLKRGSRWRRVVAARRLASFDRPDVVDALHAALAAKSFDLRLVAALSLAEMGRVRSVAELVKALTARKSPASRRTRVLFRKLLASAKSEVVALLDSDISEEVTALIVYALGRSGEFAFAERIVAAARDGSSTVRLEAYRALAALGHPSALAFVEAGLMDSCWRIRAQAAACAGRIGLVETAAALDALLEDANWWARYRAGEALYRLGETGRALLAKHGLGTTPGASIAVQILNEKALMG